MPSSGNTRRRTLREDYRTAGRGIALTAPLLFVGLLLTAALIAVGIWLWTASSGARGDASVTRQHDSGRNQVAQNTKLLGDQATVLSDQQKLQVLAADRSTRQDQLDLQGLELNCLSDVAAYNADVRGIMAAGYLPGGLPSAYPTTVCEVSS
jgi:hypothetical protein